MQQEPRSLARYSDDKNLQQAYFDGKDLYAWGASLIFKVPYEDCLEFYPEGTKITKNGKEIMCGYKTEVNKILVSNIRIVTEFYDSERVFDEISAIKHKIATKEIKTDLEAKILTSDDYLRLMEEML